MGGGANWMAYDPNDPMTWTTSGGPDLGQFDPTTGQWVGGNVGQPQIPYIQENGVGQEGYVDTTPGYDPSIPIAEPNAPGSPYPQSTLDAWNSAWNDPSNWGSGQPVAQTPTGAAPTGNINSLAMQDMLGIQDMYRGGYMNANGRAQDFNQQIQGQNDLMTMAQGDLWKQQKQYEDTVNNANAQAWGFTNQYTNELNGYKASNNSYQGQLDAMNRQLSTPLQAGGYGANVQSDAESLGMQRQSYGQLQGAANGSLDYQSQGAQAYADQQLIAAQQRGVDALWGVGGGSLDVGFDPELRKRQGEALDQYDQWRTPELTAQESYMKELARLEQEQQESASRSAYGDLFKRQGMGGSGMELQLLSQQSQQNSQNRLLGDLGANANAVARAERSLQGYAGLSSQMQDQHTVLGTNNNNRRLQGLGMYQAGATDMRNADFSEKYSRGMAADQASANNQSTRLGGMQSSAQLATNMRQQADDMSRFNKDQQMVQQRYQDSYAANERDQLFNRQNVTSQSGINTNMQNAGLAGSQYGANQGTLGWTTGNSLGATDRWTGTTMGNVQLGQGKLSNSKTGMDVFNQSDQTWIPGMAGAAAQTAGQRNFESGLNLGLMDPNRNKF